MWDEVYEGSFKGDKRNGYGKLKTKLRTKEGEWLDGSLHGHGKTVIYLGSTTYEYIGDFKRGVFEG